MAVSVEKSSRVRNVEQSDNGAAGFFIPDGPAVVAGELAGGYLGSKVGGKIGRQIDKARNK